MDYQVCHDCKVGWTVGRGSGEGHIPCPVCHKGTSLMMNKPAGYEEIPYVKGATMPVANRKPAVKPAAKKAAVPKKGAAAAAPKPVEDKPVRTRKQWTANDHRNIVSEWTKVGFKIPEKSMVPHLMKGYALDEKTAMKMAVELDIKVKQLLADNVDHIIDELGKLYDADMSIQDEDVESID